jgi:hypothetical protein
MSSNRRHHGETVGVMPRARKDGLVIEELADETLVYDLERDRAHCLNPTAAKVWRLCDGKTTVTEMVARLGRHGDLPVNEDVAWLALDRLARARLLRDRLARPAKARRWSRREVMRSLGAGGAVLVPLVTSIVAPTAAQAATGCKEIVCEAQIPPLCGPCLNLLCTDKPGNHCNGNPCSCN